jgi:hypothetical protein
MTIIITICSSIDAFIALVLEIINGAHARMKGCSDVHIHISVPITYKT